MKFRSARLRVLARAVFLASCAPTALSAQSTGNAATHRQSGVSVPFVGCVSYGQTETLTPPKGTSRTVMIRFKAAEALAYYESADGVGVLGPRGWYCEGVSGSSGAALWLSPKPIYRNPPEWNGFDGPAIELSHTTSEAAGWWQIAEITARMFPAYRATGIRALEGMDQPIPRGPYPKDLLTYRSKTVVEYTTPAQTDGLGTQAWLRKNARPIRGAAVIFGDPHNLGHDLLLLSVRLPADLDPLTSVIVHQMERDAAGIIRYQGR